MSSPIGTLLRGKKMEKLKRTKQPEVPSNKKSDEAVPSPQKVKKMLRSANANPISTSFLNNDESEENSEEEDDGPSFFEAQSCDKGNSPPIVIPKSFKKLRG